MLSFILCILGAIAVFFGGGFLEIGTNGAPLLVLGSSLLVLGGIFAGRKMTLGKPIPFEKLPNDKYHKYCSFSPYNLSLIGYITNNGDLTYERIIIKDLPGGIPDESQFEVITTPKEKTIRIPPQHRSLTE